MRGPRTQAERDAQTVEIGFALLTGALMAGLCLLLFVGLLALIAGVLGRLPLEGGAWLKLAGGISVPVFIGRVVYVLMRAPSGRLSADTSGEDGAEGAELPYCQEMDAMDETSDADRREGAGPARCSGPSWSQPSQPGRTSPDS